MSQAAGAAAGERPRTDYVIRGGHEGKRRLELLSRTLWPTTFKLLKRTGIREGMACLDAGCGGGDVTLALTRLVGETGRVVGMDMDGVKLEAARKEAARRNHANVEFRQANLYEWSHEPEFDRIYARFLLTHLSDPHTALCAMRHALLPGGILVIEDIDFSGSFSYPRCPAYDRYVDWYRRVVERRKGDADIGPKLYGLLVAAGLQSVHLSLIHPIHIDQEEKHLTLSTLINIADAVLSEGLTDTAEFDRTIAELEAFTNDPTTVMSLPRIFQAWGTRS